MSEKQFDHIENRIREAAENSEPDFDAHAWELMEAKLNKEDDRKPRFLLWVGALLLLCITAGGIYFWNGNGKEKFVSKYQQPIAAKPLDAQQKIKGLSASPDSTLVTLGSSKAGQRQLSNVVTEVIARQPSITVQGVNNGSQIRKPKKVVRVAQKGKLSSQTLAPEVETDDSESLSNTAPGATVLIETKASKDRGEVTKVIRNDSSQIVDSNTVVKNNKSADSNTVKKKIQKLNRFYLLAVGGADAGSVKLLSFRNNEITPKYGIGIGYQISKRLSVQTGFYASWKKYIAGPGDYNYKAGSYWTTVKMIKVDAACLVYDIPLTVRYDFIQRPSINYFTTAGLSSFIMKKEDYNYHYTRNNLYYQSMRSYTGNKTFFSAFNLSGGVEKRITPAVSLLAETSIALPLAGVGDGSVKLYSTALQLGVKYKPTKQKK